MKHAFVIGLLLPILLQAQTAQAAPSSLLYRYEHFLFTVSIPSSWHHTQRAWTFNGQPFVPPSSLQVDGDITPSLPPGVVETTADAWEKQAIIQTLEAQVASKLRRAPGEVTIRTASGKIVFDGVGLPGRDVDLPLAADLTIAALTQHVPEIFLPVTETQPAVTVADPALVKQGIKEVVTVGESDFSNSPANRLHNITVGLSKFNGHLIPKDSAFSFDQTLGRVDDTTGYLKELVIKGAKTEPDYGGGLCQVSTTAYRGVWEYGFPILKRINHSYSVSHYFPQGTDATVFPPFVDMQFKNDSPGSLLMQTATKGTLAYFIYYGTKDDRKSEVVGPYTWDPLPPPPNRTEYTLDLKPGEVKKLGERVPGLKALWYRFTQKASAKEVMEPVFSSYEARPHYELIGVSELPSQSEMSGTGANVPLMFMEDTAVPGSKTGR